MNERNFTYRNHKYYDIKKDELIRPSKILRMLEEYKRLKDEKIKEVSWKIKELESREKTKSI